MLIHLKSESRFYPLQLHSTYFLLGSARGQMYECKAQSHGALLSLPHGAHSEDAIRKKAFRDYIRDNVGSWFRWSRDQDFLVERMEDLILVTGCTLATSWAAAVFNISQMSADSNPTTISLDIEKFHRGDAQFVWRNDRGNVDYHNSHFDSVRSPGYVFLPWTYLSSIVPDC